MDRHHQNDSQDVASLAVRFGHAALVEVAETATSGAARAVTTVAVVPVPRSLGFTIDKILVGMTSTGSGVEFLLTTGISKIGRSAKESDDGGGGGIVSVTQIV